MNKTSSHYQVKINLNKQLDSRPRCELSKVINNILDKNNMKHCTLNTITLLSKLGCLDLNKVNKLLTEESNKNN